MQILKVWLPVHYKTSPEALKKRNNTLEDPNLSDSKVDAVLSALSAGQARHLMRKGLLLPVRNVVFETGYHFRHQPDCLEPFLQALKRRGIPTSYASTEVKTKGRIVNQQYHFIAANHHDRAVAALLTSRKLDKYLKHPVEQIVGPLSSLPSTTELAQKRGFERVGSLLEDLSSSQVSCSEKPNQLNFGRCSLADFESKNIPAGLS